MIVITKELVKYYDDMLSKSFNKDFSFLRPKSCVKFGYNRYNDKELKLGPTNGNY